MAIRTGRRFKSEPSESRALESRINPASGDFDGISLNISRKHLASPCRLLVSSAFREEV